MEATGIEPAIKAHKGEFLDELSRTVYNGSVFPQMFLWHKKLFEKLPAKDISFKLPKLYTTTKGTESISVEAGKGTMKVGINSKPFNAVYRTSEQGRTASSSEALWTINDCMKMGLKYSMKRGSQDMVPETSVIMKFNTPCFQGHGKLRLSRLPQMIGCNCDTNACVDAIEGSVQPNLKMSFMYSPIQSILPSLKIAGEAKFVLGSGDLLNTRLEKLEDTTKVRKTLESASQLRIGASWSNAKSNLAVLYCSRLRGLSAIAAHSIQLPHGYPLVFGVIAPISKSGLADKPAIGALSVNLCDHVNMKVRINNKEQAHFGLTITGPVGSVVSIGSVFSWSNGNWFNPSNLHFSPVLGLKVTVQG